MKLDCSSSLSQNPSTLTGHHIVILVTSVSEMVADTWHSVTQLARGSPWRVTFGAELTSKDRHTVLTPDSKGYYRKRFQ